LEVRRSKQAAHTENGISWIYWVVVGEFHINGASPSFWGARRRVVFGRLQPLTRSTLSPPNHPCHRQQFKTFKSEIHNVSHASHECSEWRVQISAHTIRVRHMSKTSSDKSRLLYTYVSRLRSTRMTEVLRSARLKQTHPRAALSR
jgi:hypothetical protein